MDCARVKNLLSGYIDQALDKKSKELVESHLLTCKACSEYLEEIKKALSEVKNFRRVLAPENFLEKVHQRIKEKSEFDKIVSKFFVTPKLKISIEAAGVLASVILVVAVFRFMHPEGKPTYYPQINEEMISMESKQTVYPNPKKLLELNKPIVASNYLNKAGLLPGKNYDSKILTVTPDKIQKSDNIKSINRGPVETGFYLGEKQSIDVVRDSWALDNTRGIKQSVQVATLGLSSGTAREIESDFIHSHAATESFSKGLPLLNQNNPGLSIRQDDKSLASASSQKSFESSASQKPEVLLSINSSKVSLSDCVEQIRLIVESHAGLIQSIEIDGSGVKNVVSIKIPSITYPRFIKELNQLGIVQISIPLVKLEEKYLSLRIEIAVRQ